MTMRGCRPWRMGWCVRHSGCKPNRVAAKTIKAARRDREPRNRPGGLLFSQVMIVLPDLLERPFECGGTGVSEFDQCLSAPISHPEELRVADCQAPVVRVVGECPEPQCSQWCVRVLCCLQLSRPKVVAPLGSPSTIERHMSGTLELGPFCQTDVTHRTDRPFWGLVGRDSTPRQ